MTRIVEEELKEKRSPAADKRFATLDKKSLEFVSRIIREANKLELELPLYGARVFDNKQPLNTFHAAADQIRNGIKLFGEHFLDGDRIKFTHYCCIDYKNYSIGIDVPLSGGFWQTLPRKHL